MSIKQLDGSNAYSQALKGFQDVSKASTGNASGTSAESAFAQLVSEGMNDVREATNTSEVTGAKALVGQADLVDVVTAVSNAEMVVDTVVRVRDKVMMAYNQISKMPI